MVSDPGIGAVGGDADGALLVGPPQSGTVLGIAVHNVGMGVMEDIEAPAGDDDVFRADRLNEIRMT